MSMVSIQDFGEFITKQYGLLCQILSCLKDGHDLANARLVCREWRAAVDSVVDKNPTFVRVCCKTPSVLKPALPALVLYQMTNNKRETSKCSTCKEHLRLCPCRVSGPDTVFLAFNSGRGAQNHSREKHSMSTFQDCSFALLLSSTRRCQVSTFCMYRGSTILEQPLTDEVVNECLGGAEPIKCLLIMSGSSRRYYKIRWINKLLREIIERQGLTFAVGGGIVSSNMMCTKGYVSKENKWKVPQVVLISFRGDSVTAYSDILRGLDNNNIKPFMKEMASAVGPVPEGGKRVAFVARCIDKLEWNDDCENKEFAATFPSLIEFGFVALGEFGMRGFSKGIEDRCSQGKKPKMSFDHVCTTSFVILTFDKI